MSGNERSAPNDGRSERIRASGVRVDPETSVTPRQLEMLALYASGYSYEDIARMKFFSPHTVRNYLKSAESRSGARSLTHLCMALVEAQMIRRNAEGIYEPVADLRLIQ